MSKTTLVTQQVQLQEWFQMMVSALSKGGFSIHINPVIMIARC